MVLVILHRWQLKNLMTSFREHDFSATIIDAQGGFLREGMVTLIAGTSQRRLPYFFCLLPDHCPSTTRYLPFEVDMDLPWYPESEMVEVRVGGAVAFVVPVENFLQL
jgi:uncharacterized protein YaaQ